MKTNVYLIILSFVTLFGCSGDNDVNMQEGVFAPMHSNDDVTAFFEEYLPNISGSISECFFVDSRANTCIVINSVDKFKKVFSCSSAMLPEIDFNSNTLIIGQYEMPGTGYLVAEQKITIESKKAELHIDVQCPEGSYTVICPLYYWGIYPKILSKSVNVNVAFNKGGLCS